MKISPEDSAEAPFLSIKKAWTNENGGAKMHVGHGTSPDIRRGAAFHAKSESVTELESDQH
jgi:hypothetical protein